MIVTTITKKHGCHLIEKEVFSVPYIAVAYYLSKRKFDDDNTKTTFERG